MLETCLKAQLVSTEEDNNLIKLLVLTTLKEIIMDNND